MSLPHICDVVSNIIHAIGGVGLFLVGMILLTDGLRHLAGRTLRRVLARFTSTPLGGTATGALATAVIQSSSATTVTVIGFVGAGLMTFPQALGVIYGANIGTTATGWLVAVLGFKLHLGSVVLPVILVGALMRLFGGDRLGRAGIALAGFSLIFIGIDAMQAAMAGLEGTLTPDDFPGNTLAGRLELVLIGAAVTVVTQSSSAGVAIALAALGAGTIDLAQAGAMVIGMNVGTTSTAMLATLGTGTASRRTGYAHLIFNVLTGIIAFVLLGPFTRLAGGMVAAGEAQIALVAFHTAFNLLGAMAILPFTGAFARLVVALVPHRGDPLTRALDPRLLREPEVAIAAASNTVNGIAGELFRLVAERLEPSHRQSRRTADRRRAVFQAMTDCRDFVVRIVAAPGAVADAGRTVTILHALDHLFRLYYRSRQDERIDTMQSDHQLRRLRRVMAALIRDGTGAPDPDPAEARANRFRRLMHRVTQGLRQRTLEHTGAGTLDGEDTMRRLDAIRWLHRCSYHVWRIRHHLGRLRREDRTAPARTEAAIEVLGD